MFLEMISLLIKLFSPNKKHIHFVLSYHITIIVSIGSIHFLFCLSSSYGRTRKGKNSSPVMKRSNSPGSHGDGMYLPGMSLCL